MLNLDHLTEGLLARSSMWFGLGRLTNFKPQLLQTAQQWVSLVRHGNRFGLRTTKDEAESLHGALKPLVPFINSSNLSTFVVGPFPFGASILKIFASWGWSARPTQPKGRAANNLGILWLVQSASRPEFEIYQLEHADVLVSEVQPKRVQNKQANDLVASANTFAALKASPAQSSADPLMDNDPWAGYTPTKFAKPSPKEDHVKFDALVASVEKRVSAALTPKSTGDVAMHEIDNRVTELEARLGSLEASFASAQQVQHQQNMQLSGQIVQVQHQVEQQSSQLQQVFDQRLDQRLGEQLQQIERLLTKRRAE